MFKDNSEVERAERDQEADTARINAAVEAAEKAIIALASRQLDPKKMRDECSAIRDRTILAVRDVRHNIINRANSAKETERWMVEKWLREVADAKVLHEFTVELQKVATRDLVDYLRYLIQVGDLTRIQSVNAVFAARADNERYKVSFEKMLARFTLSQCGSTGARIANICELAERVDLQITGLFSALYMSKGKYLAASPAHLEGPNIGASDNELASPAPPEVTNSDVVPSPSS